MRRIFIDSDNIDKFEYRAAQRTVYGLVDGLPEEVFDEVVDFAWHEPEKAWDAVKRADEIYAQSSLIPLCGYGSYTGSVVVMDVMMAKAIAEDIRGKSIFFLRQYKDIEWEGIDLTLVDKAFKHNFLYTLENYDRFEQVDIDKLIRDHVH